MKVKLLTIWQRYFRKLVYSSTKHLRPLKTLWFHVFKRPFDRLICQAQSPRSPRKGKLIMINEAARQKSIPHHRQIANLNQLSTPTTCHEANEQQLVKTPSSIPVIPQSIPPPSPSLLEVIKLDSDDVFPPLPRRCSPFHRHKVACSCPGFFFVRLPSIFRFSRSGRNCDFRPGARTLSQRAIIIETLANMGALRALMERKNLVD